MQWTIPGTLLTMEREDAGKIEKQFEALFLGGDLVLSQVSAITGLEAYHIQNWVKRGFLPPPRRKRYTQRQLCRICSINMLRSVLTLEEICRLLGYVNGDLSDESDDMIDDSVLYFRFVELAARSRELLEESRRQQILQEALAGYQEPVPGAAARVSQVLDIMLTAWLAAQTVNHAREMLTRLP